MTREPGEDDVTPDQVERARDRATDLRHRVANVAERIAESEDKVAETFEVSALLRPHASDRLRRAAQDARDFAEHEREQSRRLRRPHDDAGRPTDDPA